MKEFRFLNWTVYKDSKKLFSLLLHIVQKLPKEFRFELGSQIIRSGMSVILNIAEGSGKNTDRELNRYFDISLGSLNEILASADVLKDIGLLSEKEFRNVFNQTEGISRQLGGFKKRIKL